MFSLQTTAQYAVYSVQHQRVDYAVYSEAFILKIFVYSGPSSI